MIRVLTAVMRFESAITPLPAIPAARRHFCSARPGPSFPAVPKAWAFAPSAAGFAATLPATLGALGAKAEAFGTGGNDGPGRALQKCLRAAGIAGKGVIADSKRITAVKTRIIARHQQVVRVDHERREPLRGETQEKLLRLLFT